MSALQVRATGRYTTMTRQETGRPYRHRGYVFDLFTRRVVRCCGHAHNRRGKTTGAVYARACAARLLRAMESS